MEIEDIIILLICAFIIILLIPKKKNENFKSIENNEINTEGRKLIPFPNFYEVFGSNNLNTTFEFPGTNNWKLFTNTPTLPDEGLPSLISTLNPTFYNFDDKIRLTGFSKNSAVIGLMTPTKIANSGQWMKSFDWGGVSNVGSSKNAKNVVLWGNHKKTTDININKDGKIDDAIEIFRFSVPEYASLGGTLNFKIKNYNSFDNLPFTTYYFQILDNWGDADTVKVNCIIPYFEI
jgi:hypothetical protein